MAHGKTCDQIERASELLGMKWILLIVYQLLNGPMRFAELEHACEISGRLLSDRLKVLEREEIVTRTVYAEVPVRVEYNLTEKGYALAPVLNEIGTWAFKWIEMNEEIELHQV